MMECPADFTRVEERLNRVLTQYRESPKLLHMIRTYLRQIEMIEQAICDMPDYFDINNAVGDQLTLLGKRLGFPRRHCVCEVQPVFGFDCGPNASGLTLFGFCSEATWLACSNIGLAYVDINDDELYRKFLKVRRYQVQALFDTASLKTCIKELWGNQATILDSRNGKVVIAPGRDLSVAEQAVLQLYPRVLPVPLGIKIRFHLQSLNVFGFGTGWNGFCQGDAVDGDPILTYDGEPILTATGEPILAANLGVGANWMCALDVRPYDC